MSSKDNPAPQKTDWLTQIKQDGVSVLPPNNHTSYHH